MKNKFDWLMGSLLLVSIGMIIAFFYKKNIVSTKESHANMNLIDSVGYLKFTTSYLADLIDLGYKENGKKYSLDTVKMYKLDDGNKQHAAPLSSLFKGKKDKMVVRFTEIGCDACADSTFKIIRQFKNIDISYDVLVLVDFTNYDAYLKWKKISEISYPIFWVRKGDLPFGIERAQNSYIFIANADHRFTNFFVPNSRFPNYIKNYFYNFNQTPLQ